ncbi:MarR family transcriptional regulator [Aquimarina sp. D1M17]|uniref:MarR family winged helix-turn-helix transcriptional regulator n=1 Tax=Aquimarina acroporae TaxID=2937283 RepID=UPI0020C11DFE|nr:MarR family transcriptional regulator [Aquimarina acroporae]MCK8521801.1 MarR family transcriptional regulator [Aquimarina acroporae]
MENSQRNRSLAARISVAQQLVKRNQQNALKKSGINLTMDQMLVLEILYENGNMNMTQLSKGVWKQNTNITRIVDKLEKQSLVSRKSVAGDRRANLLMITKKGKKHFETLIPLVIEVDKAVVGSITKKEEELVIIALDKIIKHFS